MADRASGPTDGEGKSWPLLLGPALVGAGSVAAAVLGLALTWDGAWFAVRAIHAGQPAFENARIIQAVLQSPVVVAGWLGASPAVLIGIFGLPYALVPVLALAATWHIVHSVRPGLIAWPVLGIGLCGLPGQAFLVSEALAVTSLGWPLVLAAGLGRVGAHRPLVAVLAVIVAVGHPFGVGILGIAAIAAAARSRMRPGTAEDSTVAIALAVLAGLALVRFAATATAYEEAALTADQLVTQFRAAVLGRPLAPILAGWAIGVGLLAGSRRGSMVGGIAAVLVLLGVAAVMTPWAAHPAAWSRALGYRAWVFVAEVPLLAMACLAAIRPPDLRGLALERRLAIPVAAAAGAVTLTVLVIQGLAWRDLVDRAEDAVATASTACVSFDELPDLDGTPIDHWSSTSLLLLTEAPTPRHLLAYGFGCPEATAAARAGRLPIKAPRGEVVDRLELQGRLSLEGLVGRLSLE